MENKNQRNQRLADDNTQQPMDSRTNTDEVLDENGQVIGGQTQQTPLHLELNQTPRIGRGGRGRGQIQATGTPNGRGAPLHQPFIPQNNHHQQPPQDIQPIYYEPYYIAPPQLNNQHLNPLFAP